MEKFGLDLGLRLDAWRRFSGQAYRQRNLEGGTRRDVAEATLRHEAGSGALRAGFLAATDRRAGNGDRQSLQAVAGGSLRLGRGTLGLRADHYQSLGSRNASADFPTRTILGADLRVWRDLSLFATQEITDGRRADTDGTRVGLSTRPWAGSEVSSSVGRRLTENGPRVYANLGLKQTWRLGRRWFLDAGLDHSRTLGRPDTARVNPNTPPASGATEGFTAATLGASGYGASWQWNTRVEWFDSRTERRWGLVPAVLVQPTGDLGLAAGGRFFLTDGTVDRTQADLRFSLSLRPDHTAWMLAERLDLILDREQLPGADTRAWRIVSNLNLYRSFGPGTQVALRYGAKYVGADIEGRALDGYTDLLGLEARRDLGKGWDAGLQAGLLRSLEPGLYDYFSGLSLGRLVAGNVWAQAGYNVAGFEDADFSAAGFTAHGPFLKLSARFDTDALARLGFGYRSRLRGDK